MTPMRRLRGIPNFLWIDHSGHDRDGDRKDVTSLVGPDGRIFATVDKPQRDAELGYFCQILGLCTERTYLDLPAAKAFCEGKAMDVIQREHRKRSPARKRQARKKE
jgi:hypothetical protein